MFKVWCPIYSDLPRWLIHIKSVRRTSYDLFCHKSNQILPSQLVVSWLRPFIYPASVLYLFMLSFNVYGNIWSNGVKVNLCKFFDRLSILYIAVEYSVTKPKGGVWILLTSLNPPQLDFQCHLSLGFFLCPARWWEVIVRFVDIGEIVDHHCLSFLFITNVIRFKIISITHRFSSCFLQI
jgi:hypothetical protein